jgi:hypothetical protein
VPSIEGLPSAPRWLAPGARAHYNRLRRELAGRARRSDVSAVALVADAMSRALDPPAAGARSPTASERASAWGLALRGLSVLGLVPHRPGNVGASAALGVDVGAYTAAGRR